MRVKVDRALGRPGRSRRIQPEANVVGERGRSLEFLPGGLEQPREVQVPLGVGAGHDHVLQVGKPGEDGLERLEQGLGHDEHLRAAVAQHVFIIRRCQQRVERHRDDAGLDRAEESGREVDRVEERERHPLFALHAECHQRIGGAVHPLGQLGVSVLAGVVDVRDLASPARLEVALDQIDRCVVLARDCAHVSSCIRSTRSAPLLLAPARATLLPIPRPSLRAARPRRHHAARARLSASRQAPRAACRISCRRN